LELLGLVGGEFTAL
jgi:hypothetical protein